MSPPLAPCDRRCAAPLPTAARVAVRLPAASCDETFRALGTDVRLIAAGPGARAAVARARAEILDYHARLSRFDPASELCALNADPRPVVPASALLRSAVRAGLRGGAAQRRARRPVPARRARGRRLRALVRARRRPAAAARRPVRAGRARPRRRWRAIRVDDEAGTIERPPGLRLDLGGSGKGHVADLVARRFDGADRGSSTAAATSASAAPARSRSAHSAALASRRPARAVGPAVRLPRGVRAHAPSPRSPTAASRAAPSRPHGCTSPTARSRRRASSPARGRRRTAAAPTTCSTRAPASPSGPGCSARPRSRRRPSTPRRSRRSRCSAAPTSRASRSPGAAGSSCTPAARSRRSAPVR